jgi:hypothetical protein
MNGYHFQGKLGELLAATVARGGKSDRSSRGGTSNPLPSGITKKESHQAQTPAGSGGDRVGGLIHYEGEMADRAPSHARVFQFQPNGGYCEN